MWAPLDCYLSLLWIDSSVSWSFLSLGTCTNKCIAYWFPGNFLGSVKLREGVGRLKSMLPVLSQSQPFGCPLRTLGRRAVLDIILRIPCTCSLEFSCRWADLQSCPTVVFSPVVVQHSWIHQMFWANAAAGEWSFIFILSYWSWRDRKSFIYINGEYHWKLILKGSKLNMESIPVVNIDSWKNTTVFSAVWMT